jgi:hypothetical protein
MEPHGFIHDMLDVKLLILFVMDLVDFPIDSSTIYDLCFQDETLSYFDLMVALPEMVASGHLAVNDDGLYTITEKGHEREAVMADDLAFPVRERARAAVAQFNVARRRDDYITAEITPTQNGEFAVEMRFSYERGELMHLGLTAPTEKQARAFATAFRQNAEDIYQTVLTKMLDFAEKK